MHRVGDSLTKINTAAGVKPDRIVLNHKISSDVERVAEVTPAVKTIVGCIQVSLQVVWDVIFEFACKYYMM